MRNGSRAIGLALGLALAASALPAKTHASACITRTIPDPQLMEEFWRAFVTSAGITLHLAMVRGRNTHHILEASAKGVARALRDAVRLEGTGVPSTKGVL